MKFEIVRYDGQESGPLAWQIERMCLRKRKYGSFEVALELCSFQIRKYDVWLVPYQCRWCKKWHVTRNGARPWHRNRLLGEWDSKLGARE